MFVLVLFYNYLLTTSFYDIFTSIEEIENKIMKAIKFRIDTFNHF